MKNHPEYWNTRSGIFNLKNLFLAAFMFSTFACTNKNWEHSFGPQTATPETLENIINAGPDFKNPLTNTAHDWYGFNTNDMKKAVEEAQAKMNSDSTMAE